MEQTLSVLLVEDNPADSRLIREYLKVADDARFEVFPAESLSAAIDLIEARHCDVILLDLSLPDSQGLETLHRMHAHSANTPIIVLTGLDDDELALTAMRHGAQDYLLKGKFDLNLLTRAIRYTLERKRAETEIKKLAYYDPLTGLPNRLLLHDRLRQYLAKAVRSGESVALLFLDLDRFKVVNDSLGHSNGDLLLQEVARRLAATIRSSDTIARLGGDEFVVALSSVDSGEDISRVAGQILSTLKDPLHIEGHEIYTSASIGIAFFPDDGETADDLMKHADIAMYQAKEHGRNNYQFFSAEMNLRAYNRQVVENHLRKALQRQEFFLVYQPQLDIATGEVTCVEALVRWDHPERGVVPPLQFISLAEETGLIIPIGEWVLRTACAQNKTWQDQGLPPVRMAVNISGRQFKHAAIIESVRRALHDTGLDPRHLELELTESTIMTEPSAVVPILNSLKALGVGLSIDDFGTGYSSLSCLKHFPIDRLKIDRSFVSDIGRNSDDEAIAEAIICMARSLRIDVVAEGVEQAQQLEFLRGHNCHAMQGFYISHPLSAGDCAAFLADRNGSKPLHHGAATADRDGCVPCFPLLSQGQEK
jgi:diguanylate cyclase (GGDEF)-like protein